jgi:hypothetical protein
MAWHQAEQRLEYEDDEMKKTEQETRTNREIQKCHWAEYYPVILPLKVYEGLHAHQ